MKDTARECRKDVFCDVDADGKSSKLCLTVMQMLAAKFTDPILSGWYCRGLEAFSRCIAAFPSLMPVILQKVLFLVLWPIEESGTEWRKLM